MKTNISDVEVLLYGDDENKGIRIVKIKDISQFYCQKCTSKNYNKHGNLIVKVKKLYNERFIILLEKQNNTCRDWLITKY